MQVLTSMAHFSFRFFSDRFILFRRIIIYSKTFFALFILYWLFNKYLIIISRELMKTLISIANDYIETSDWKTITALKFCLLSLGAIAGMQVRDEHRKPVTKCALTVFLATYIPLMAKLIRICIDWREAE